MQTAYSHSRWFPNFTPLIHTSQFMYTPSKRSSTLPPSETFGLSKALRYQPTPPTVQPVAIWPSLALASKGPVFRGLVPPVHDRTRTLRFGARKILNAPVMRHIQHTPRRVVES